MSRFITLEIISNGVVVTNSSNGGGMSPHTTSEDLKDFHPDDSIGEAITDMVADFRTEQSKKS